MWYENAHYLIIPIPINERSEICPFCIKTGHYLQLKVPKSGTFSFSDPQSRQPILLRISDGQPLHSLPAHFHELLKGIAPVIAYFASVSPEHIGKDFSPVIAIAG